MLRRPLFFFNDTATTEIYTLSLHDALPISHEPRDARVVAHVADRVDVDQEADEAHDQHHHGRERVDPERPLDVEADRKSTRLNSSHANISYAVFCLKKNVCRLLLEKKK